MNSNKIIIAIYLMLFYSCLVNVPAFAQTCSYDSSGKLTKAADEKITISIDTGVLSRSPLTSISLPGVFGAAINIGTNVVKTILSNRDQKFTATYSATSSEKGLVQLKRSGSNQSVDLNISSVIIKRELIFNDLTTQTVCKITLQPDVDRVNGLFRFKLTALEISGTKAKITSSSPLIELSINLKIDALWIDQTQSTEKTMTSVYKSATLGESTMFFSGIKPQGAIVIQPDATAYSGWFQLIPSSAFNSFKSDGVYKVGNYALTATIKEVNPYELSAKKISDFLSTNSTDIQSLLKQFISSPTSK